MGILERGGEIRATVVAIAVASRLQDGSAQAVKAGAALYTDALQVL